MASLYKKPVFVTDPMTGKRIKTLSRKWWGRYRDATGTVRRVPLAADKMAAHAMLNRLLVDVEREKAGLFDPMEKERKRPLSEHLREYKSYLVSKGVTAKQVSESTTQIQKILDGCNWCLIGDITAVGVVEFLNDLRRSGRSAQTANHYLKSGKSFTRWLVLHRRTPFDPLSHVSKMNVQTDRRHDRRPLMPEEFGRLIQAAHGGPPVENIPGTDRAMMYMVAGWTGLRKGEIGSLRLSSFNLDAAPPTVTVQACFSKHRRQDRIILHAELVERLKEWLERKPGLESGNLLFPVSGRVPCGTERKTHLMMRRDLEAARSKWLEEARTAAEREAREKSDFLAYENQDGLFADFHSNRHLFISTLVHAGLSAKMTQTLARHSDVRLTLQTYAHVTLHDQTAAIESMPAPPRLAPLDERTFNAGKLVASAS